MKFLFIFNEKRQKSSNERQKTMFETKIERR